MKKIFFIFLCFLCFCSKGLAVEKIDLDLNSKYVILYNLDDDTILYEKNSNDITSIASLTKIMTSLIALENINSLDDTVILNSKVFEGLAEANASVAGFKYGEKVTYRDLIMGALLPSGADATRALALNISGSEDAYVELMNKKVEDLKLKNTHFENTTGLESKNHYSTVYDISQILKYALKNDEFYKFYTTREYTTSNGLKFYSTLKKISNNYTIDVGNILGSKTGFTDEAGLCMSSISKYNDINYLLVTAGANSTNKIPNQLIDATTIYNYFSNNYGYHNIINKDTEITKLKINFSKINELIIYSNKDISKYLNNNFNINDITLNYVGLKEVSYKNKVGEKLGYVEIIYNDDILDKFDLFLENNIEFNLISYLLQTKLIYPISIIIVLFIILIVKFIKKINKK